MVICRQCGRPDVQGTLYCQSCGASLEPDEPSLFRGETSTPGVSEQSVENGGGENGGGENSGDGAQPYEIRTPPPNAQGPSASWRITAEPAESSTSATPGAPVDLEHPADALGALGPTDKASRPQRMRPTARIAKPPAERHTPKLPMQPAQPIEPPYAIPTSVELRLPNGHLFLLSGKQEYRIGRRDIDQAIPPDVDFTDWNGAIAGVSRDHLSIFVLPGGVFVEDHESTNDTLCNGARLQPRQRYLLRDRDELRLGTIMLRVLFVYRDENSAEAAAFATR